MDDLLILLYDRARQWAHKTWSGVVIEDTLLPLATTLGLCFGLLIPGNEILPDNYRVFSSIMGWTYFFMWAISFWPQVVTNYKNQCTTGLKSDKLAYDLIGFECLVIYEGSMFFSSYTRKLYGEAHDGNEPEVEVNDVWFANHSMLLTFIVIGQMVYYDGWKQWPTRVAVTICTLLLTLQLFGLCVLAVYGQDIAALSYLSWLYLLSAIKVLITFLKFLPQVLFNYERKSTQGWSMPGTVMDLCGSVLSISQLVLDCYFLSDWRGVEGNFIKLGLGVISGTYDVIFIVQHYLLYPGTGDQYKQVEIEGGDLEMSGSCQGLMNGGEEGEEDEVVVDLSPLGEEDSSSSMNEDRDTDRSVSRDRESDVTRSLLHPPSPSPSLGDMDVTWIVN